MDQLIVIAIIAVIVLALLLGLKRLVGKWADANAAAAAEADSRGEPLVDIGQGATRRTWPPEPSMERHECEICQKAFGKKVALKLHQERQHPRVSFPPADIETAARSKPTPAPPLASDFRPQKAGATAAEILKEKFGGANVGEWVGRALEGRIEMAELLLMQSVCKRALETRMRAAAPRSGKPTLVKVE